MSKNKKILLVLMMLFCIYGRIVYADNIDKDDNKNINESIYEDKYAVNENEQRSVEKKIKVKYEYDENKNQVIAKIVSDTKLKDTKPTWKLSDDGLSYTKIFLKNEKYTTMVVDIDDNTTVLNIDVRDVRDFEPVVSYEYNQDKNFVVGKITSNVKLMDTKPTWSLSEDKYIYTKFFYDNQEYHTTITDVNGNSRIICINVKDIQLFDPRVVYEYDEDSNSVTAIVESNVKFMNTKPTWNLSKDGKKYTKTFSSNQMYTTAFNDVTGNSVFVDIDIKQIDEMPPEISTEHKFNKDGTVTIYLKSNKKLKDTKPSWILSEDKLVYKKTFDNTQKYTTNVQAQNGKSTIVSIDIKLREDVQKQDDGTNIYVRYLCKDEKIVEAQILGNGTFNATKPTWNLSEDSEVYSKKFDKNTIYETLFQFTNGKSYMVQIIVIDFEEEKKETLKGIDVSVHNGIVDWVTVKNSGIDFAILRCGYGENITSQDDKYFVRNMNECERLGIKYGVYIYSYALNENGAISEANHVLRLIKGHNIAYGVWFDMEDADGYKERKGMPSNATLVNICKTFCDKIRANGYDVGIYASYYWFVAILNDQKLDEYDKWVAQWSSRCSYQKPYKMWQYTATGSVNGISGNVDMNYLYM